MNLCGVSYPKVEVRPSNTVRFYAITELSAFIWTWFQHPFVKVKENADGFDSKIASTNWQNSHLVCWKKRNVFRVNSTDISHFYPAAQGRQQYYLTTLNCRVIGKSKRMAHWKFSKSTRGSGVTTTVMKIVWTKQTKRTVKTKCDTNKFLFHVITQGIYIFIAR